jgi:DivIVA domain-containing protein
MEDDGRLTADDVRDAAFRKPPMGKRGYNEDEVDALLHRIYTRLADSSDRSLTAADIHSAAFSKPPWGKRGYNEDDVDAFLTLVEAEIRRRDGLV